MPPDDKTGADVIHVARNKELFSYLVNTFKGLLPPEQGETFVRLAGELNAAVSDNCGTCHAASMAFCEGAAEASRVGVVTPASLRDPRRQRFLLRLVSARISRLFVGDQAIFPRTLVEGVDRYLRKALGDIVYTELNREAGDLLAKIGTDDDKLIWERIYANADWRRFADTILIRILLRFDKFPAGKRIFMSVVGKAMTEGNNFQMKDGHFHMLFKALFGEIANSTTDEAKRILWDYQFGEDTSKRLSEIFKRAKADRAQQARDAKS